LEESELPDIEHAVIKVPGSVVRIKLVLVDVERAIVERRTLMGVPAPGRIQWHAQAKADKATCDDESHRTGNHGKICT
jgi:hypothetical protein